jgi:hypothetical protein
VLPEGEAREGSRACKSSDDEHNKRGERLRAPITNAASGGSLPTAKQGYPHHAPE